jgi:hypothetical protein
VEETTVVELTVTPAPKEALAPAWKFVPVMVTVRLAPGAPELGVGELSELQKPGSRSSVQIGGLEVRPGETD